MASRVKEPRVDGNVMIDFRLSFAVLSFGLSANVFSPQTPRHVRKLSAPSVSDLDFDEEVYDLRPAAECPRASVVKPRVLQELRDPGLNRRLRNEEREFFHFPFFLNVRLLLRLLF